MLFYDKIIYHIYPLGFCDKLSPNDFTSEPSDSIKKVVDWIPHILEQGFNAIYFGPVFESTKHGYDTADYFKIDRRLGTNADFKYVCEKLHENGLKIILDGVFNHVGRNFWAFERLKSNRECSDWFNVNFGENSPYNDGFRYEGWEGHYDLVKLNLRNPAVKDHLYDAVRYWIDEFQIDGLRLDVAYCLDHDFVRGLRCVTHEKNPNFWLMGEMLHGDYNVMMKPDMLDSVTNYECYKGLYSSFNSDNLFEIGYSLNRQFGAEHWTLYKGKLLACFLDNHDVSRIASILTKGESIYPAYTLLYTMPGIPMVYYGSEWGAKGDKHSGDDALRPSFREPSVNPLTLHIRRLAEIRKANLALQCGDYKVIYQQNKQYSFMRSFEGTQVAIAMNIDSSRAEVPINLKGEDLFTGKSVDGKILLEPFASAIVRA